jgi:hypothetical protein
MKQRMGGGRTAITSLQVQAKMWPTPKEQDSRGGSGKNVQGGMSLTDTVRMWPTPTSRDHKDTGNCENVATNGLLGRAVNPSTESGSLNPLWTEWLMGFPIGWADCEPSETQ